MHNSNMQHIKGEISTLIVLGVLVVAGAAILMTTSLNKDPKTTASHAQTPSCPYDSGQSIQLGGTETDANNAENRVPISQNRGLYDSLANTAGFTQISDEEVLTLTKTDTGAVDGGVKNMMGSMFGYKPKRLVSAYDPPDGGTYILEVPVDPNNKDVKMPSTGYDIGGGMEAMVVFAASDRVTLHIGRHEYFTGTKTCANGKTCSGGYWIYVKNICVDQQIQNAYNQVKGAQESAGANLNPIQLPMVRAGQVLGKANGNSVLVGVRDNGPFISIYKSDYWGGVPEKDLNPDQGTNPTSTTVPTNPPVTPSPTPRCQQTNYVHCPNTGVCVPALAECEGVPTNTSIPTSNPSSTPTSNPNTQNSPTPNPTTTCMDIEQVSIDIYHIAGHTPTPVPALLNKAKAIKIKRKTNTSGGVQVGYNAIHIAGPGNLPDTSGDVNEKGFETQAQDAHFFGEYTLNYGESVNLKVDTFPFQASENYAGISPCRTINYTCTRLRQDGYATCERGSSQTSTSGNSQSTYQTTTTPIPTQNLIYLPFLSMGDGSAPTPIPTVVFSVTTDVTTQTFCSEEVLAFMASLGITKPVICIK